MSVLFKALERAARARNAAKVAESPVGQPTIMAPKTHRRPPLKLMALALGIGAVSAAAWYIFVASDEPAPQVSRPQNRLAPHIATPAAPPPPTEAASPTVADAAPAGKNEPMETPAANPAPPPAASSPAPPAPAGPAAALPAAAAAPAQSPAPPRAPAELGRPATEPASAAKPPLPPPAQAKPAPPVQTKPAPPVEEDLPGLLARLRREKMAPAIAQPVAIARSGASRNIASADGETGISVGVGAAAAGDLVRAAYDLLLHGHFDEALTAYQAAAKSEPKNVSLLLGEATALQKLQRNGDAQDIYRKILILDPHNRPALTNMTALIATQSPEQALSDLDKLRLDYPDFSPIDAEVGALEAARGNGGAAIEAYGRAVNLSPENGLYRLNLAILQDRAGMAADAATSYRLALNLLGSGGAGSPIPLEEIRRRLAYLQGR